MDDRVIEFVRGMRAAGVRISLAESMDAMRAIEALGITDKAIFKSSIRATLIKEVQDFAVFDQLFPLYFGSGGPMLQNALDDLSSDDQEMLQAALQAMSGRMQNLLDWLTSGEGPTKEELEALANQAGAQWANSPSEVRWVTRQMLQQMGLGHLEKQLQELAQKLQEMGMSQEAIERLMGVVQANREALAEQVAQQIGLQIAQERANRPDALHGPDLMHKPFSALSEEETAVLRKEVQRLVTQLRTRAAMRRKRGARGKFDSKSTIRANQRYGGVPLELRFKKNKLKPSLVLMCDMSRSMFHVTEFMLTFIYQLQDQVSKTRSFAFYSDMQEVSHLLNSNRADDAAQEVFDAFYKRSPGHYATDFGGSLDTFYHNWLSAVNGRTTVVILGDGRNNYNSPRLDLVKDLQKRARRVIWFCSEQKQQWGTDDSDMREYAGVVDSVYVVRNLAQLATAVDNLLAGD
ncbi:MAG: VWA domain-containing protein [Chloroflexi bacterium]|nr:VWA domain-containing protein [Chloroflexota bacterium]